MTAEESGRRGMEAVLWNSKLRSDSVVSVKQILTREGEREEKQGKGMPARPPPCVRRRLSHRRKEGGEMLPLLGSLR